MSKRSKRNVTKAPGRAARPFPWKRLLLLIGLFFIFFAVYEAVIARQQIWILHVYCIAAGVLAAAYILLNRGILSVPVRDSLPSDWDEAEKDAYLNAVRERRRRTKWILYLLLPLILTVLVDTVSLLAAPLFSGGA